VTWSAVPPEWHDRQVVSVAPARRLFGRQRERDVLERLLGGARAGRGTVLVVDGDPGIGKTALLDYLSEAGSDFRPLRALGVEREIEIDYAALQQLCAPILKHIERLPHPQSSALSMAFGQTSGEAPSPFLVGLAVLGLLAEAAEERPLLCMVDDAQWLDGASSRALTFVARRLLAERIALVFATRDPDDALTRFPQLTVGPLGHRDARALLQSVFPAALDEPVLERIVAETGGNPLAILELPRGLSPAQLAGGFGLPSAVPLTTGIERSYLRRLSKLPRDARRLLLLAAAEPVGDPALLFRAAALLGIPEATVQSVELEGFLRWDGSVVMRHPLVRSVVYQTADATDRRETHRALADATDPRIDPDRHAWHRAQAAAVPNEEVAAELERSAARAQARGGFAAAAAFLDRAAKLTPDAVRRSQRSLIAADMQFRAGALDDAISLLASADTRALDELDRARVAVLRAQIAFVSTHGSDAPTMLLDAARQLEPLSPGLAYETYLEALSAAIFAGHLAAPGGSPLDVSLAAGSATKPTIRGGPELLLEGFAALFSESYSAAATHLREALNTFEVSGLPMTEQLRWKWLATVAAVLLWDDVRWEEIAAHHVQKSREAGALAELPLALSMCVYSHLFTGDLVAAALLLEELRAATDATGTTLAPYGAVGLAAMRGREADAVALITGSRDEVTQRGEGIGILILDWAEAVLYNGLGRYEDALAAAVRITERPQDLSSSNWWMIELIEAAARVDRPELAADTRARLSEMATASATEWVLGTLARADALLADDEHAEALYVEAIAHLGRTRMAVDLARTRLLFGEWLRRQRRRVDAREQLRTAHDFFDSVGMEAFAARARVELEATGERARSRSVESLDQLTPQEAQVARLAAQGNTNREIAAQLFISPTTVEYHLHKAFRKLGVKSRTQLAHRAL
jgi:DNA-binding CsgD family transcriptional regulator